MPQAANKQETRTERWLITGATGQLGSHLLYQLSVEDLGDRVLGLSRSPARCPKTPTAQIDLEDRPALTRCVEQFQPTHVLHVGGMTSVAQAHQDPDRARRVNVAATQTLADACAGIGARMIFTSTDMVFDGTAAPYRETDTPNPLSQYGQTKLEAERTLTDAEKILIVRLPLMYGHPRTKRQTTFTKQIDALRKGQPLSLFTDEFRTPIHLADAAKSLITLARSNLTGLIHVAGPQRLSRYEMVERFAACLNITHPNLQRIS
ncbi:MAG: SDR family oxidoreductase, partial [Phycisphaerae bacterium]